MSCSFCKAWSQCSLFIRCVLSIFLIGLGLGLSAGASKGSSAIPVYYFLTNHSVWCYIYFNVLLSFEVTLKIEERNVAKNCQKTLQMFHRFLMTKILIMVIIIVLMIMMIRPVALRSLVRSCWPAWLLERALKGSPSFFRLTLPSSMLLFSLSLSSAHLQSDICHDHYKVCRRLHPLPCGGEVPEEETVWRLRGIPTYSSCKPQERSSKYLNIFLFSILWSQNWQC